MKTTIFCTVTFFAQFFNGNVKIYIVRQLLLYRQCGKISQPQGAHTRSAMSKQRAACGPVEGFVQPSLGVLCSENILHTDNLSLFS